MSQAVKSPRATLCVSLLFSIIFSIGFLAACKSDYPASARQARSGGESKEARQVKTVAVAETPFGETVTANGTLAAFDQTTVSVKVPGRLRAISVDLGTVVSKGQVIAQLEPEDYKLRVQQAEASLSQARARLGLAPDGADDNVDPEQTATVRQARAVLDEARFNRDRAGKLVEQGIIAKADFDTANAAFKVAEGRYQDAYEEIRNRQGILAQRRTEVALARQQLKDTAVYSPLDGIVQEKKASAGEYLAAGAPVDGPGWLSPKSRGARPAAGRGGCSWPSTGCSPWPPAPGPASSWRRSSPKPRWPTCCRRWPPSSTSSPRSGWPAAGGADGGPR